MISEDAKAAIRELVIWNRLPLVDGLLDSPDPTMFVETEVLDPLNLPRIYELADYAKDLIIEGGWTP